MPRCARTSGSTPPDRHRPLWFTRGPVMKNKKDDKDAPVEQAAGTDDTEKRDKKKGKKDKKGKKGTRTPDQVSAAVSVADGDAGAATAEAKPLKGKAYEKELEKLHAKLVKLQEWV